MSHHISQSDLDAARVIGPRIAVIGGGTGLSTMLRGLKLATENITAIVTVSDDGGGSGQLRQDLGMLPPGDIRNCLLALANAEPSMCKLLNYRFTEGKLAGQSFGNLFLAALNGIYDSFDQAVFRMSEVLAITGRVLPVTTTDVYLEAFFEDGTQVIGETNIVNYKKKHQSRIKRVELRPGSPEAYRQALESVAEAEMIILGPGSLYTSIIPNLLVGGMARTLNDSTALKVYVCNVMTQEGETEGYSAFDHVQSIISHSGPRCIDVCLVNSESVPPEIRLRYDEERAVPVFVDRDRFAAAGIQLVERPLALFETELARHNSIRLAYELLQLRYELRPRDGIEAEADVMILEWLRRQL